MLLVLSHLLQCQINASVPDRNDPTEMFYFDEEYIKKCHDAKSNKALSKLPGSAYYSILREKENEHFVRYNNGFEVQEKKDLAGIHMK